MNKFDYNKPKNGGYPYINNSSPSRQGGGAVIDLTGMFTKVYLNCDSTSEEVEEAFGNLPYVTAGEAEGYYAYAFSEIEGLDGAIGLSVMRENSIDGYTVQFVSSDFSSIKFFRYNKTNNAWEEGRIGAAGVEWDETSGIHEIENNPPAGPSMVQLSDGTVVGAANDKLTKILSFNEPFGSAAEDHELSYTNRDGIVDKDFRYDKPRNGGYPFTNIDGPTPADSTKFLNWTRRDDNDEPVPPGPQAPNYLKYSSEDPFMFYLKDAWNEWIKENPWDGEMQYATGDEPGEDDWLPLEYDDESIYPGICVVSTAAEGGMHNIYLRANPGNFNTHILGAAGEAKAKFVTDPAEGPGFLQVTVSGNIMALFNSTDPNSAILPTDTFALSGLFEGDENIVDASELVLSAMTLVEDCYNEMFSDCTSLTKAPSVLPATTLAESCYGYMFRRCTALTTAPELPATTLAESCYEDMFYGCTDLTTAPELPATELAEYCYNSMFGDCTSLVNAPSLPATELANGCYCSMFSGCTSLATLPIIHFEGPSDSSYDVCYNMFGNCGNIKLSTTSSTGEYTTEYSIPNLTGGDDLTDMFDGTGGDFTGTPTANTTYYTSNAVV